MNLRRAALTAALATAVVALLTFGVAHAIWLVPIWPQLIRGLPFTVSGALALAWAFAELRLAGLLPQRAVRAGLAFGLGAWVVLLPATALGVVFRVTGLHGSLPDITNAVELASAGIVGLVIGLAVRRGWRLTSALTVGATSLLAVQAGPVAITNGRRAVGMFVLLAGIYAICGMVQAVLTDQVMAGRLKTMDRTTDE